MRRLSLVGVLVGVLLSAACGGKSEPLGPTATVPHATTTTNPYAIPAVIDEAYVNRVLAGLDQAYGEITRLVVTSKAIPPEAVDRLRFIYIDQDQFQFQLQRFQSALQGGLEGVRPVPGDRATTVLELISTRIDCVFAMVDMDTSAVAISPDQAFRTQWIAIVPLSNAGRALGNRTGWGVIYEGSDPDQNAPSDPCDER